MTSSKTFCAGLAERLLTVLLLAGFLVSAVAGASEVELGGSVAVEPRFYLDGRSFAGQAQGLHASLVLAPELTFESEGGSHQLALAPYLRLDDRDSERTHGDLREASYRYVGSGWELLAGVGRVFWGVTESRHLVDVINQDDAVEDIDGEDKLGQPMVELSLFRNWGTLSVYALPAFRERTFPGLRGRLRTPLVIDTDRPVYESSAEDTHFDFALRSSHVIGDWDLGLSYFDGTGREPRLLPGEGGETLVPHYDLVRQLGVDVQYTRGAWLWKLESLARDGQGPRFGAAVAGFEYTLFQVGESAADLGLLAELLWDGRSSDPAEAPPTVFDSDLFLGARLALNDTQDTSALAGFLVDGDDGSWALTLESERRLLGDWKLELEARLFFDVAKENALAPLATDDFVTLRLSRFF